LVALQPYTFVVETELDNAGDDDDTTPPSDIPTLQGPTIQEPIFETIEVGTTVSVPDGGTLLLGGQTLAGETQREAGVPVLSKIPFLKRLVTNTSTAKDEQVVLILVKPTIIIQHEQEAKQFPLLSSRAAR
jgi:general secretion pathway protein D